MRVAIALLFRTHISPGLAAVSSTAPLRTLADLAGLVLLSVGGFFVREPAQLTVFILGPSRSNPYLPLLHGMSSERGTANPKLTAMAHRFPDQTDPLSLYETNPNADLQTDVFLLQLDLAANARDIRLRTTVHEPGLIDGEFADRVERIRRNGRTQRDSERLDADEVSKGWFSSADRTERQHALVYEILDSDVVVLTFPVDTVRRVMAQNPNDSPERSEVTGYLEAYETILGTLPEDRCLVYGMGTDLLQTIDSYAQLEEHPLSGSPEVWEDFRTSITGEMDKHLDLEGGLEAHLDDEDSALYPIWISGSEIRGADRFLQDVDPSRER